MEDFSNTYEVEKIIKSRTFQGKKQYLCYWEGYGHRDNTWENADQFLDKKFIAEYENLSNKEKKKRIKFYENALKKEQKLSTICEKITFLSETKIKQLCDSNTDTWKLGRKLYQNDHLLKRYALQQYRSIARGIVASEYALAVPYRCSAKCNSEGVPIQISCECIYSRINPGKMCKHVVCLLLDRCATTTVKKKKQKTNKKNNKKKTK